MKMECANCAHHDVFWMGSGCNKKAAMEPCEFKAIEGRKRMKPLILIIGPTCSGKTTLAKSIHNLYGLKIAKSTTTRQPRFLGEDEYHFVTPEVFDSLTLLEQTEYAGRKYGMTKEELEDSDIFVCDPTGVMSVRNAYKGNRLIFAVRLELDNMTRTARMKKRRMSDQEIRKRNVSDYKAFRSGHCCPPDLHIHANLQPKKLAEFVMEYIETYTATQVGVWQETDPDCAQHIKMIDRNHFECVQVIELCENEFAVSSAYIDLSEYTEAELLDEIRPFGYDSLTEFGGPSTDYYSRRLIAECAFENHALENIESIRFATYDKAEKFVKAKIE